MDTVSFSISDFFKYIEIVSNIVSFGIGVLLGSFVCGGFINGFNHND